LIALTALWVFQFPDLIQRIGCILTALGTGFIIYQIRLKQLQKGSAKITAARMGHVASAEFYRTDLQRELEFYCSIWLWSRMLIFAPGLLLIMLGPLIAHPNKTAIYLVTFWLVSVVGGFYANLWMSRRLQREISELEKLQKDQS
jgi:hypothetical protein